MSCPSIGAKRCCVAARWNPGKGAVSGGFSGMPSERKALDGKGLVDLVPTSAGHRGTIAPAMDVLRLIPGYGERLRACLGQGGLLAREIRRLWTRMRLDVNRVRESVC